MLAERFPAAREPLAFLAEVFLLQASWTDGAPLAGLSSLVELTAAKGPAPLAAIAQTLDEASVGAAIDDCLAGQESDAPESFFARVLLQPRMAGFVAPERGEDRRRCPRCASLPQLGCLRPEGDGARLSLVCSLCLEEWDFPRGECAACDNADEKSLVYYQAEEIPHLLTMMCEKCRRYLHLVDFAKDLAVVPDIDEMVALPLDVWATERGYRKIRRNLTGI